MPLLRRLALVLALAFAGSATAAFQDAPAFSLKTPQGETVNFPAAGRQLAPTPIPASEWGPWVERYLATLKDGETMPGTSAPGPIADGKAAIARAREVWSEAYGAEQTLTQAPYRSYRKGRHWVVLASGEAGGAGGLGAGFICVIEADSGRVLRIAPRE